MTYLIPIWFLFPVEQIQTQSQQPINQSLNQSMQPCPSTSMQFDKEKWEIYLNIYRGYLRKKGKKISKKLWTKQEEQLLIELYEKGLSWNEISQVVPETNSKICKRRYQRVIQSLMKWPQQLDMLIKQLAQSIDQDWIRIHQILYPPGSLKFPKHSTKQLKERYLLNLKPAIINEEWRVQEDIALLNIIREKGTHWRKLSEQFIGRTQLQLKNRYYGTLKPLQRKVLRKLNTKMKQIRGTNNNSQ